jgi:hypothetical protein
MPPLQKASQIRSIWLRSSPVSTEDAVVPGAMGAWAAGALAPWLVQRVRPPLAAAAARAGASTPGAFKPPPGPFTPSAAPIATTRPLISLRASSLIGSPASCSRAAWICSFVIRLPSSGIRAIRASVRSARSGIRAGSGKAGAQATLHKHYYNAVWDFLEPKNKKRHTISIPETANLCTMSIGFYNANAPMSSTATCWASSGRSVHR